MKRILYRQKVLLCWLVLTCCLASSGWAADDILARVKLLAAPEFAGRGNGTTELLAVGDSLVSWLSAAGLEPGFGELWTQEFPLTGLPTALAQTGRNVAGLWRGQGKLASRYVVVTAHYDHLGRVDFAASGTPTEDSFFPGANDNASGVAVVLDLIHDLTADFNAEQSSPTARRSVLFVFFGGEEIGLQGSAHFVQNPPLNVASLALVLNFDTVGVITDDRLYVSGLGSAAPLTGLVAASDAGGLQLAATQKIWGGSDHMSFVSRGIPALFVFGGPYANYNRTTDTWQNIAASDLSRVANFAGELLGNLITHEQPLVWQEGYIPTLDRVAAEQENRDTWFGSLPDFGVEGEGYALAGVFAGSPADRAGLSKGDVVVTMAGESVAGLVEFTRILRAHAPGDLIDVGVMRGGLQIHFTVVLGDRKHRP